jgi:hypothetical protein
LSGERSDEKKIKKESKKKAHFPEEETDGMV